MQHNKLCMMGDQSVSEHLNVFFLRTLGNHKCIFREHLMFHGCFSQRCIRQLDGGRFGYSGSGFKFRIASKYLNRKTSQNTLSCQFNRYPLLKLMQCNNSAINAPFIKFVMLNFCSNYFCKGVDSTEVISQVCGAVDLYCHTVTNNWLTFI